MEKQKAKAVMRIQRKAERLEAVSASAYIETGKFTEPVREYIGAPE